MTDKKIIEYPKRSGKQNKGCFYNRTKGKSEQAKREKAFALQWQKEDKIYNILQTLFIFNNAHICRIFVSITPLHRYIVATVIQWLGSTVGFAFLENALKRAGYKIKKIK